MNKTEDIEWEIRRVLYDGPLTLEAMETRLPPEFRAIERTWIGIAVHNMERDGRIRFTGCDHRSHEGYCVVEAG